MKKPFLPVLVPLMIAIFLTFAINGCQKDVADKTPVQTEKASANNGDGQPNNSIPAVTAIDVSAVTATTAVAGGIVTLRSGNTSPIVRGLVWDTFYFPTLEHNLGFTVDPVGGVGSFTNTMTGLTPGKVLYVCAYASNSAGTNYTTGEVIAPSDFPTQGGDCPAQFTDTRNNKTYHGVQIGEQCWMKENLNLGRRLNFGTVPDDNKEVEKFCYNDSEANCDVYGALYTWDEMMDYSDASTDNPSGVRGICPEGWHVPSVAEITQLKLSLGGKSVAGGKLKAIGYTYWLKPNTGATNSSGFTALGTGYLTPDQYANFKLWTSIWTTSQFYYPPQVQWYSWTLHLRNNSQWQSEIHLLPQMGNPVRCLKDPAAN